VSFSNAHPRGFSLSSCAQGFLRFFHLFITAASSLVKALGRALKEPRRTQEQQPAASDAAPAPAPPSDPAPPAAGSEADADAPAADCTPAPAPMPAPPAAASAGAPAAAPAAGSQVGGGGGALFPQAHAGGARRGRGGRRR